MRPALLVAFLVLGAGGAACVEVPQAIRTEFTGPSPSDRSNFRAGAHGTARPAADDDAGAGTAKDVAPTADGGGVS
jgi:hypothetical protein